ncbi:murein transglycosylase domain-containing protein [Thiomicrorhabdus sp. zzn3]|uniref:murein transglycosylase domain-containing protein n=1 Tax=Thiomicrorhabdus sp. zzn3 TaxID=3039775 RepID=UPI0024364DBD|nr:murein transglycosylase domain-containing protein [Thiomicrorhabdus sp. zzn3]MDG6778801.1 murein transglycosylase domain-containing protein [Thiomicrorhabdus sp. zzn3]
MASTNRSTDHSTSELPRRQWLKQCVSALPALCGLAILPGCTVSEIRRGLTTSQQLYNGNVSGVISAQIPGTGVPPVDGLLRQQLTSFLTQLGKEWGEERIATPKEFVKYTDHYQSRALINFTNGHIRVETLVTNNSKQALKDAIINTLLTPQDPSQIDLFNTQPAKPGKTPFLHNLVQDQDGKAIRYAWRAGRFADYLLRHRYNVYQSQGKTRHAVDFDMVQNYQGKQQLRYQADVMRQARRFNIEPALIYGIIETESAFNPYAVSSAPAYGLMQIVPSTAGRDVHRKLHQRDGMPSKQTLFNPSHNIEYGTAYLSILFDRYLSGIRNRQSQEYCVIAAYNTGSGNVLRSFDRHRQRALDKINRMTSQQVYHHLRTRLTYAEARNYLAKVTANKRNYLA